MLSLEESLNCIAELPSIDSSLYLLQKCREIRTIEFAKRVHVHLCECGLEAHEALRNYMVPILVECGCLLDAQQFFNRLVHGNEHSWTSLILGYIECGQLQHAFDLYQTMQEDGVYPSSYTLVALLKACTRLKDVERGRDIHVYAAQKGFQTNPFVGSTLIDMYAKCGSLVEAKEVFDKVPVKGLVVWNSLIAGYAEHGHGQEALQYFEQMQQKGVAPDAVTFACSLKACGILGALDKCRRLQSEVFERGFERELPVGNSLVGMYAKCGFLSEASEAFYNLPVRNVVSWNTLIAGYAEHGPGEKALKCFEQMQLEGLSPDSITFACTVKACSSLGSIDKGQILHMEIIEKGFERDLTVGNSLVGMYTSCGSLAKAWEIVNDLPVRDVVTWNTLISGCAEHGLGQKALRCFEQMQAEDILPNAVTFACIFKACGSIGAVDKGQELQMEMAQKGIEMDLSVGNTLVGMYANCGLLSRALEVFEMLPHRNVVSWTALITGYAEHGPSHSALECFEQMGLNGVSPNAVTFGCVLKACGSLGATLKGREVHREIVEKGLENDAFVGNNLVAMYAKVGLLSEAQGVFDNLPVRDVVAWSAIIRGYGMNHEGSMAIHCFEAMKEEGVQPNAITFTSLFTACCHASLVTKGQEYFKLMRKEYGIEPTIEHYTCIVDLLARSGHLHEAEKFLDMLCPSSQGTWGALLNACKTYGEPELGVRCFQELVNMTSEDATWYVLMADVYFSGGRCDDAIRIEELRKHAGAKKKCASALIEVSDKVHAFVVGDKQSKGVSTMVEMLNTRMKAEKHMPNLDLVLKPFSDECKEAVLCEHAEKLAIAFGLLNTPQGQTLRVTKNLRMCNDCHSASKIISRIESREIILRDDSCIHSFKDGLCSCGDMF